MMSIEYRKFISDYDGQECEYLLDKPVYAGEKDLPVVLAPHPRNWSVEEDYQGGGEGALCSHPGWAGLAEKHGFLLVAPRGHSRATSELTCSGYEGQMQDMWQIVGELADLGLKPDWSRIYVCGLSMGGQEALLFAGKFPERVAAAFAFNPLVDMEAAYEDHLRFPEQNADGFSPLDFYHQELGGTPGEAPEEYRNRSPIHYAGELTAVPVNIWWTDQDGLVKRSATHQGKKMYDLIKQIDPLAPASEYNHTKLHGFREFGRDEQVYVHEYCDYEFAVHWLFKHRLQ